MNPIVINNFTVPQEIDRSPKRFFYSIEGGILYLEDLEGYWTDEAEKLEKTTLNLFRERYYD